MASQNFRKNYVYRYKLSDNYQFDQAQIAGVTLTKNWADFKSPKEELSIFIQSTSKPEGFIDFEKYDSLNNEIAQQSKYTGEIPDIISRETLNAMERFELVPIAKYYEIDCVQKDAKMLIKMIIERQNKRVEYEQKSEEEEIKKENILIVNTNNQLQQQYFNEDDIEKRGGWFGFGNKK